jgi:hypothetical protein
VGDPQLQVIPPFNERIVQTGHINEVLAALNEPLVQHAYRVVS